QHLPPLFPYTTLFRSTDFRINEVVSFCEHFDDFGASDMPRHIKVVNGHVEKQSARALDIMYWRRLRIATDNVNRNEVANTSVIRSEEHTSELQSRENL